MGTLEKINRAIIRYSRVVALTGLLGLLIVAVMTVVEGVIRSFFHIAIMGASDLFSVVLTVTLASCFPLVLAERRSVTIRMVGNLVGPRGNALLESFGSLLTLGFFGVVVWQLWVYAGELFKDNVTTYQWQWRLFPWYYAATVFFALCVPAEAFVLYDHLRRAFQRQGKSGQEEKPTPREKS